MSATKHDAASRWRSIQRQAHDLLSKTLKRLERRACSIIARRSPGANPCEIRPARDTWRRLHFVSAVRRIVALKQFKDIRENNQMIKSAIESAGNALTWRLVSIRTGARKPASAAISQSQ
jgi:hypothetical protein